MALTRCAAINAAEHGIEVNAVPPSLVTHPVPGRGLVARAARRARDARRRSDAVPSRGRSPPPIAFLASDYAVHDGRDRVHQQSASENAIDDDQSAAGADAARRATGSGSLQQSRAAPDRPSCSPSAVHVGTTVRDIATRRDPHPAAASTTTSTLEESMVGKIVSGYNLAAGVLRRDHAPATWAARDVPAAGARLDPGDGRAPRGDRHLPERGGVPGAVPAVRLPRRGRPPASSPRSGSTPSAGDRQQRLRSGDLDPGVAYHFLRDTIWTACSR